MVNMRSNIIVVRKIKERLHIVLRWRQLENERLRRYVDSIERLEILASRECMQCSCDMHNVTLIQIMTHKAEHFGKPTKKTALRDQLRDLAWVHVVF